MADIETPLDKGHRLNSSILGHSSIHFSLESWKRDLHLSIYIKLTDYP
jgi:hypothetical protein